MLTIFINNLLFICNKLTPLPKITKYRYHIHINKLLNKCRHLHNIICDENIRKNWRLVQLDVDIKIKKYNIDLESKVLSSNNKSIFYKFINKKLHSSNCISPLYNEIDNSISSFDFYNASCLLHQYSYVFNKSSNINIPILPYHLTCHHYYHLILLLLRYYVNVYVNYLVNSIIHQKVTERMI